MLPVDHIGLAVHDGKKAEHLLNQLALATPALPEDLNQQGVRIRFYGKGTRLEILEALGPDSAVTKFLSKRGEGLHHIAFRVANVQLQLERMHMAGFQPLTETPVLGADGKRIFFLHPKHTSGILVEFCQPKNQYHVRFDSCPKLERTMELTGHCIPHNDAPEHVVTAGSLPQLCQSLVLHNASFELSQHNIAPPPVPILISETSTASHFAHTLHERWPNAQLAVLPESSQYTCLPEVLLNFWASVKNG
ncbi:MAG: VOC family protein [Bacteroidetes bacterium]|nr:VOC family protein [Bacteroidota bacterium]